MRSLHFKLGAVLLVAVVVGACDESINGVERTFEPSLPALTLGEPVCTTVDFDGFAHGDPVTALTVLGVNLTLSGVRFDGANQAVDPTAYDVELTGADLAALNATHDDTQAERDCSACTGLGRMLVVPDENFAVGGDNTEGGSIAITGFAADVDGVWSIESFDVVDGDVDQGPTTLFIDAVATATSDPPNGNATVETVSVPANTITSDILFTIGVDDLEDASGGIDNLLLCRAEEENGGGEGCTPGYWKQDQHFDSWASTGFATTDLYCDVFGVGPCITLLEALNSGGGDEDALLRHSVAALLNAASPDVDYDLSPAEVIAAVQAAYASGDFETTKDEFEGFNEQFCPID